MKPVDLVRKHIGEYRQTGDELKPVYCPFCGGGNKQDKYTFAINQETGGYNCLRGSCGARGSFRDLLKHFGEEERQTKSYELTKPKAKAFNAPKVTTSALSAKSVAYLKSRGFSPTTWEKYGVSESKGALVFPYYEDGKLVLVKYRKPEKYLGQGQKAWREPGGKAVFWGLDLCDQKKKQILICEGEMDQLALTEAGVVNVVSVPSGAEDLSCIDNCWDWLEQWETICIWPDNDAPGQEMCRKLIAALGSHRCYVVHSEFKDANEALYRAGKDAVKELVRTAKPVPMAGLVRLSDVESFDFATAERVSSSLSALDKLTGGYLYGTLSVWTGENSSGKSTLLGQELIEVVAQGKKCCVYSGEMPMPIFRYWIDLQCAGPKHLQKVYDQVRRADIVRVDPQKVEQIRAWYSDSFYCHDALGGVTADNLLEVFSYAAKRYGCKVFLIDNLMMMVYSDSDRDFYRKQSDFVKKCKAFARQYECHVHLVAHPRKVGKRLEKADVMGSGDITNLADYVFSVYRVPEDKREEENCDAYLDVFKSRMTGEQDEALALLFDKDSKRFYLRSELDKLYATCGWETANATV